MSLNALEHSFLSQLEKVWSWKG